MIDRRRCRDGWQVSDPRAMLTIRVEQMDGARPGKILRWRSE
jgi:hypothetical protein